jgi:hypothetical protein
MKKTYLPIQLSPSQSKLVDVLQNTYSVTHTEAIDMSDMLINQVTAHMAKGEGVAFLRNSPSQNEIVITTFSFDIKR